MLCEIHYFIRNPYTCRESIPIQVLHVTIHPLTELRCIRIARKGVVLINPVALEKTCISPFPEMKGETQGECPL